MDVDSSSGCPTPSWQFRLWTMFATIVLIALSLSVFRLGGMRVLAPVIAIGLVSGGAVSILGSNKEGMTPLYIVAAATASSLLVDILCIQFIGYHVVGSVDEWGKSPPEAGLLALIAVGGTMAAATRWDENRLAEASSEHQDRVGK